ncbi:alpha-L-rhamnosidase C-terminal domain-containing protein [Paraflavisolibacter sp. H34]|uniref:alpha-L-rhamnosidase-related protein n=1 Tax=Huijunlia imazamoxiresistens TaxID=3127457 RepID=UPI003016E89E
MQKKITDFLLAAGALVLFQLGSIPVAAQSKAHDLSRFALIDPAYRSTAVFPKAYTRPSATSWIYGPAELECWRLQELIQRKDAAKLNVGYTGAFHTPFQKGSFRLKLESPVTLSSLKFRSTGKGTVYLDHQPAGDFKGGNSLQELKLGAPRTVRELRFAIDATGDLPGLLLETAAVSTGLPGWEWTAGDTAWKKATHFPQHTAGLAPHRAETPAVTLAPVSAHNNLYDFGRELFGYLVVRSKSAPEVGAGESEPEALDRRPQVREQSVEMEPIGKNLWRTKNPLGFRYARVENSNKQNVSAEALVHPGQYRGAFACSDSLLTQIWMNSAYTLRLCMRDFLLDGIKRDRLPWAGDLTMSSLVNAFTFHDGELVRRSLVALSRAGIREVDINAIVDFSLLWIIAEDQYQLYFADATHLREQWGLIRESLRFLAASTDDNGFLVPRKGTRLFLDWVKQEKWTALQVLWWWAQTSGAKLAQRVGDGEMAGQFTRNAARLKAVLNQAAWSQQEQRWLSKLDGASEKTRHPNFLSVVSGLSSQSQFPGIKAFLQDEKVKSVGSPYMGGFEVMALARLGDIDYMLGHVKNYWGGMVKRGATSFWEAYTANEPVERQYSFYNRPYGKSLCHAWSSGPAALLSSELFGLKPLEDGWKKFTLRPQLGNLGWASVCVPTHYGDIKVDIEKDVIQIDVPAGTALEWKGRLIEGPRLLKDKL